MQGSSNTSFYKLGKKGGKGGRVLGTCRDSALTTRSLGEHFSQLPLPDSWLSHSANQKDQPLPFPQRFTALSCVVFTELLRYKGSVDPLLYSQQHNDALGAPRRDRWFNAAWYRDAASGARLFGKQRSPPPRDAATSAC